MAWHKRTFWGIGNASFLDLDTQIKLSKLYANVHSSFICKSFKLERTQMAISQQLAKETVAYPCSVIQVSNKNNKPLVHTVPRMNLKTMIEKLRQKEVILYDSIYKKF